MAIIPCSSGLMLCLSTLLLILASCDGRPEPPEFTSFFTSPTSIRVEWGDPTLDPGATVKGFRLQYKLGGGNLNKLKVEAKAGNSYEIEDLTEPCGEYLIRMSTASSKGMSRYSSFSQVDRVHSGPQDLNAIPSSDSARVTWSPPTNGFCITGYQLKYGPNENELQTMDLPTELTQYLLSDLQPGTSYLVTLAAVARGENSEEAFYQWYQAGAPTAPANLKANPSSPETAIVMWSPTSSSVTRYDYLYGPSSYPDGKLTTGSVEPSTMLVELTGLVPDEEYVFKVKSVSSVGQSETTSTTWTQPTPDPVVLPSKPLPAAPAQVNVEVTSAETARVFWTRPEGEAEVTGYIVGFGLTSMASGELTLFSVGPDDTEEELDGLKTGSEYVVTVQAYNDVGDGEVKSTEWLQQAPPEPLSIPSPPQGVLTYSSSPTTLVVRWVVNEAVAAEQTEGFRVTYGRDRSASDGGIVEVGPEEESVEIQDLQPDTFYYLRVYKFNSAGQSESVSRSLQTMTPPPEVIPPPTSVAATVLSPTSARLSWVDQTLGDSQLVTDNRFYNVRYRSPLQREFLEQRTSDTNLMVDFLLPGVQFEFAVQLVLDPQRRSEVSEAVFVTSRDPAKGAQPARFTVTQVTVAGPTSAKAILNWLPPPERQDVTEYRIEYTDSEEFRDPATVWERLTVDGSKMTAVLEGLRTDQEYHARITAVFSSNEAGPTMASPAMFTTPVVPPSSKSSKQCGESEVDAVTRRVNFLWDEVADGVQRPPLYGVPIPYCEDEFGVEECHGLFCFCVPGRRPPALREPHCTADEPPCRREYNAARQALDEARLTGQPAMAAQLPHCRSDGYYQPKQCSGTMCYCVTENGARTGQEAPMWEANGLRCV